MRRLSGSCLLLLMLTGCAAQQSNSYTQDHYQQAAMPSLSTAKTSKAKARKPGTPFHTFTDNVSVGDIRQALLGEFDVWSGTPYRFGGDSRRGIDCSALVQHIYRDSFDIDLPRTTGGQVLQGRRIEKSALKPGDLVFFKPSRRYRHVGIYVGNGYFLHASSSQGVKLSRLDNPYWMRHYWQARRPLDRAELALRTVSQSGS